MYLLRILLVTLCLSAGWHCASPEPPGREPARAQPPDQSAAFLMSDRFRLEDYRGKVVLLNFWATWCPPCKAEIPDLIRLRNTFSQDRFALVGIAVDQGDIGELQTHLRRFVDQYRINYTILLDPEFALVKAYGGFSAVPTSFLIDQRGQPVQTYVGAQPYEVFARDLQALLGRS